MVSEPRGAGNGSALTMSALANAKRLPIEFLRGLGLSDLPGGGVGIPYYDATGAELLFVRERESPRRSAKFYQPKGVPLRAYGQWRLHEAEKASFLVLVEGESDCWTFWYHGLPGLGIPGANAVKTLEREHTETIEKIYVVREPGKGGEAFVEGVRKRLAALGWQGKLFELSMPDEIKDPSDLHIANPEQFKGRLEEVIRNAKPLELPRETQRDSKPDAAPVFPDPIPASQLCAGDTATDWIWRGYLARGSVTLLTSLWKSGKSTLLAHLVKAMDRGEELAGLSVMAGKALIVSEESAALWAGRRDKLGIGDHASFDIRPFLGRPDPLTWLAYIRHLADLVRQRDIALVCFDTFAVLSPCDDENDAAKMTAALTPLHLLTEAGAGVLVVHHPRKGDASEGQASRGSGALPGFVDVIVEMRRVRPSERDNRQRELTAYSRFDETPSELVIELAEDGSGYRSLGSPADADRQRRWQTIRDNLPGEKPGKTAEEVLADWPSEAPKPGKRTVEVDLKQGAEAGQWSMDGAGRRGDPFRFWSNGDSIRAAIDSIDARIESNGQGEGEWTA